MSRSDGEQELRIKACIEKVRAGGIQWHLGQFLEIKTMQREARASILSALQELDDRTSVGRAALMPLLTDSDDGVRATATTFLAKTNPDAALPVLHDLSRTSFTEAGFTADDALRHYAEGKV